MSPARVLGRPPPGHGQHLFVYANVRTNQVVYSLSRAMRNTKVLKQLPFLGKNSKPARLRKDQWRPLATVTFPSGAQGLSAYQQLREFRKRHEHEWELPRPMQKEEKARIIMDQKANSIADLAAVLLKQEQVAEVHGQEDSLRRQSNQEAEQQARSRLVELQQLKAAQFKAGKEDAEAWKRFKEYKREKLRLTRVLRKPAIDSAIAGRYDPLNDPTPIPKRGKGRSRAKQHIPRMTMEGLTIHWANILDAEYARTWPQQVIHDSLASSAGRHRNVSDAPFSPPIAPSQVEAIRPESPHATEATSPTTTKAQTSRRQQQQQQQQQRHRTDSPAEAADSPSGLRRLLNRLQLGSPS